MQKKNNNNLEKESKGANKFICDWEYLLLLQGETGKVSANS